MFLNRFVFLLVATMLLSSAYSHHAYAQNNNRALMERLDYIEKNMGLIQRQISKESVGRNFNKPSVDADSAPIMTGNIDGDLLQQMTSLQEELRYLRGDVEKNGFEIGRLKEHMKRMQADVDFRLKSLEPNPVDGSVDHAPPPPMDGMHPHPDELKKKRRL